MVEADQVERVGLLATQGIRGGANRRVLERIKKTGDIFLAWSDEPWIVEGAAVHVSFIGYDDGTEDSRRLNGQSVTQINANLTAGTGNPCVHLSCLHLAIEPAHLPGQTTEARVPDSNPGEHVEPVQRRLAGLEALLCLKPNLTVRLALLQLEIAAVSTSP